MPEPTLEDYRNDPLLFAHAIGVPMEIGSSFLGRGESLALDSRWMYRDSSTKTNFSQRLFLDALRHDTSSKAWLLLVDDMSELDVERMSELFGQSFEPTLTTKGIDERLLPEPLPKEKAWVEMNEQHARRSQRLGSKRKKR